MMAEMRLLVACQAVVSKPFISGTCHEIEVLRCMRLVSSIFLLLCCCAPALAFGFSFVGTGREYPYPNEPQYQYPGKMISGDAQLVSRLIRTGVEQFAGYSDVQQYTQVASPTLGRGTGLGTLIRRYGSRP